MKLMYKPFNELKAKIVNEVQICKQYEIKLNTNDIITQEEIDYHYYTTSEFDYCFIINEVCYLDYPFELYDNNSDIVYNELLKCENCSLALIYFCNTIYCNNLEFIKMYDNIINRNNILDCIDDFIKKNCNKNLKLFWKE